MDAVMQFLTQLVFMAILVGYVALVAAAAGAVAWIGWHMFHDHVTLAQAWRDARQRLYH